VGPQAAKTFRSIVAETFADGYVNWGRVVTVLAFFGHVVTRHVTGQGWNVAAVEEMKRNLCEVAEHELAEKIRKLGGWDSLTESLPQEQPLEETLWRGLTRTFVALGVCSLVALAMR
jgi:hypothetical protein